MTTKIARHSIIILLSLILAPACSDDTTSGPTGDSGPVMVFDPDSGGATGRGKTLFFKLFR